MDYLDLEDISYEEFMSDGSESLTNLSSSSSMVHVAASDACDNHGNESEHDFDEFDTLDIDTNADADSNSISNEAESSYVVPEVNLTNIQTNSIVKDDSRNELKPAQVSSPNVELKPLIIETPPQQKPSGLDPRASLMYPTAEDLSKADEQRQRRHQFRHIDGAKTATLLNSINRAVCDKLYQQNVENTKEKLKDLTISESSTTLDPSTTTNNSTDISNPPDTDISNISKLDPKLIEFKDARLKLIKNFAETKQLSILSQLLQLNDKITVIQGFNDIQSISSPSSPSSSSTKAKPYSSTDKCYKQAAIESPTSAAIIGNINDMIARYSYEQKVLITGVECPYTKILRRKTAAETHQEILEQFLKYAKIENPFIESEKAKKSCKDLFDSMPEAVKKSSCFLACPFGDYFTGEPVDQVMPSESAASLPKLSPDVTAAAGPGSTAPNPSTIPTGPLSLNNTQQPQPTTISSKFSVEPGPCFNISPSKVPFSNDSPIFAYERMKECEKMVLLLKDSKSRAVYMPKYLEEHFERNIHDAEANLEVSKKVYEMLCKTSVASSDSTKAADIPKEQTLSFIDIDKLYQNMKNCEKIYEKLKSTEPGFKASHGHNEGLMGHFQNRLKEAESNWRNAQIQYNEYCAKDKLQKNLGALNSSTAYNEMKKLENLYANLMDAKNLNNGNCDENKIEETKLQLEMAKKLYEEACRAKNQLNSTFSTPSNFEASSSAAVKSGIKVKSGSQNLHKLDYDSEVSKMSKVTYQMSLEDNFNPDPTQMFATSNTESGFQANHGHNEGLMGHFQNRLMEAGENERRQLLEAKKRELERIRQARLQMTDQHFANGRPSTALEDMRNILASVGLGSSDHPPNNLPNGNSSMLNGTINESQNDKTPTISPPRRIDFEMSFDDIFNPDPTQMCATSNNEIQKIFASEMHQQQQPLTESSKLQMEQSRKLFQFMQENYPPSGFEQSVFSANLKRDHQKELQKLQAEFRDLQQTFQDTENARKTLIEMNEKLQAENQWLRNDGNLMKEEMEKTFKDSENEFKNILKEKDLKIKKLEAELKQKKDCEEEKMKAKKDAEIAKLLAENLRLKTLLASSSKPPQKERTTQTSTQSCSIIPQSQLNILPTKYLKTFENVQNDHQQIVEWVNNAKTKACEIQAGIERNGKKSLVDFEISKTKAKLEAIQLKRQEYLKRKELAADSKKQLKMNRLEALQTAKKIKRTKKSIKKPLKTFGSISMEEMMAQLLEFQDSCGFNERHPELNGPLEGVKIVNKQQNNIHQKLSNCSSKAFNNAKTVENDNKVEDCEEAFLLGSEKFNGMLLHFRKVLEKVHDNQNSTTASAESQRQESPEKITEQRESSDFIKTYNGKMEFTKGLKHSVEPLEAVKIDKLKESEQNLCAELAKAQQQIEYYQKLAADQAEALKNFDLAKSLEKQLFDATQKADKALKALGKREAMDFVSRDLVLKRFKENDDDHSPVF